MEELLEAEDAALATCSGKKCTANEHCCEDHVCIDDNECKFEQSLARRNVNSPFVTERHRFVKIGSVAAKANLQNIAPFLITSFKGMSVMTSIWQLSVEHLGHC